MAEPLEYVEGPGPGVTELPELATADEVLHAPGAPREYPGWRREHIDIFLQGFGSGLHLLLGQGEEDWLMTQTDLERIAPPLERMANRYEPTLRASEYADPPQAAFGITLYTWRSLLEAARAKKDAEAAQGDAAHYERPHAQATEPPDGAEEDLLAHRPMFPQAAIPRYKR